jgi:hypothetical protein
VHISTLEDICKQIQEIDSSIRFAGIANKLGDLKTKSYRKNLVRATIPIMIDNKDDENKLYLLLSFDLDSNVTHTIQNRVLPFILKNENVFV